MFCPTYLDEGKLYTWGKGSTKLGYETANEKQLTPKVVQSLSSYTVVQASCGKDFTLGKLLLASLTFKT